MCVNQPQILYLLHMFFQFIHRNVIYLCQVNSHGSLNLTIHIQTVTANNIHFFIRYSCLGIISSQGWKWYQKDYQSISCNQHYQILTITTMAYSCFKVMTVASNGFIHFCWLWYYTFLWGSTQLWIAHTHAHTHRETHTDKHDRSRGKFSHLSC